MVWAVPLVTVAIGVFPAVCSGDGPARIKVAAIEGIAKKGDQEYSIGGDLGIMVQPYPTRMYRSPRFFKEIVLRKFEEKKRELRNVKAALTKESLLEDQILKGIRGHGFSLQGRTEAGQELVIDYYWTEVGDSVVKIMVMGNAKTYRGSANLLSKFLKGIKVQ